jgi:hypothetical protein
MTLLPSLHLAIITRTYFCKLGFVQYPPSSRRPFRYAIGWYHIADRIIDSMMGNTTTTTVKTQEFISPPSPSTTLTTNRRMDLPNASPYIGLHLRREADICLIGSSTLLTLLGVTSLIDSLSLSLVLCITHIDDPERAYCNWSPQQWVKCINGFLVR